MQTRRCLHIGQLRGCPAPRPMFEHHSRQGGNELTFGNTDVLLVVDLCAKLERLRARMAEAEEFLSEAEELHRAELERQQSKTATAEAQCKELQLRLAQTEDQRQELNTALLEARGWPPAKSRYLEAHLSDAEESQTIKGIAAETEDRNHMMQDLAVPLHISELHEELARSEAAHITIREPYEQACINLKTTKAQNEQLTDELEIAQETNKRLKEELATHSSLIQQYERREPKAMVLSFWEIWYLSVVLLSMIVLRGCLVFRATDALTVLQAFQAYETASIDLKATQAHNQQLSTDLQAAEDLNKSLREEIVQHTQKCEQLRQEQRDGPEKQMRRFGAELRAQFETELAQTRSEHEQEREKWQFLAQSESDRVSILAQIRNLRKEMQTMRAAQQLELVTTQKNLEEAFKGRDAAKLQAEALQEEVQMLRATLEETRNVQGAVHPGMSEGPLKAENEPKEAQGELAAALQEEIEMLRAALEEGHTAVCEAQSGRETAEAELEKMRDELAAGSQSQAKEVQTLNVRGAEAHGLAEEQKVLLKQDWLGEHGASTVPALAEAKGLAEEQNVLLLEQDRCGEHGASTVPQVAALQEDVQMLLEGHLLEGHASAAANAAQVLLCETVQYLGFCFSLSALHYIGIPLMYTTYLRVSRCGII